MSLQRHLFRVSSCLASSRRAGTTVSAVSLGDPFHRPRIGLIAGAGPDAGLDILGKVIDAHKACIEGYRTDRDAAYVVHLQVPGVGGPREKTDLTDVEGEPYKLVWRSMMDAIHNLCACKVDSFVVACNTLHILEPEIRRYIAEHKLPIKFLSMIGTCVNAVGKGKKVALLGSINTTDLHGDSPYVGAFTHCEMVALPLDMRRNAQAMLEAIKRDGVSSKVKEDFKCLLRELETYDCDVVVLGCTELPLVWQELAAGDFGFFVVDPGAIVAQELAGSAVRQAVSAL